MAIIPISCKRGVVILGGGAHIFGKEWGLQLEIENDEFKNFEMTPDVNNIIWKQVITSFAGGTGTVRCMYDNTPNALLPNNKNVWLDQSGAAYVGYTSLIGFVLAITITGVNPAVNTDSPSSAMFDFSFKVTACTYTIVGP